MSGRGGTRIDRSMRWLILAPCLGPIAMPVGLLRGLSRGSSDGSSLNLGFS
jgi:hypothetical protein